jgi:hypothetical protein
MLMYYKDMYMQEHLSFVFTDTMHRIILSVLFKYNLDVLFSHCISTLYNYLWYMPKYRMNLYYRRNLQKA